MQHVESRCWVLEWLNNEVGKRSQKQTWSAFMKIQMLLILPQKILLETSSGCPRHCSPRGLTNTTPCLKARGCTVWCRQCPNPFSENPPTDHFWVLPGAKPTRHLMKSLPTCGAIETMEHHTGASGAPSRPLLQTDRLC